MLSKKNLKGIQLVTNGVPITFQKLDQKESIEGIFSSCFVEEENVIIRGEFDSSLFWEKKQKIFAIDGSSKELRGKT